MCGISLLKLRRQDAALGLSMMSLLLEKQHNRGQDGAGIAIWKEHADPGTPYFRVEKSDASNPLADVIGKCRKAPFDGEIFLGHLRYGTFGNRGVDACHPLVRFSACRNRTLLLAGNFNLTNSATLLEKFAAAGHHLCDSQDTSILLHMIGHELEKDPQQPLVNALRAAAEQWDGGYLICGITGDGNAFALRDPAGIRPGFFHVSDDHAAVASERPPLQAVFNLKSSEVTEIPPGHALIFHKDGTVSLEKCLEPVEKRSCVFERVYFSRGNDRDIQQERRAMGRLLVPGIIEAVDRDLENCFFSYIPNTARSCFFGILDELLHHSRNLRFGELVIKDAKFRTFIADEQSRESFGMHVYDVVHGMIRPGRDKLVVVDDSIVRGNTVRNMLLRVLDRLDPDKIVIGSAAPPVCYPDCYGIDMASLGELVAFQAAVSFLEKQGKSDLIHQCAAAAEADLRKADIEMENRVLPIYQEVGFRNLCSEITELLTPPGLRAKFEVVFQTPENLRACCPGHTGDWYFSGHYPTPGGNRVVNRALLNFVNHIKRRAY